MAAGRPGDVAAFLRKVPLFAGLSEASLAALGRAGVARTLTKGSYLFAQTDDAKSVYIVQSGVVAILVGSRDGHDLVINQMRTGDCFGELSLLTGGPRSTCAVARVDCCVIEIPHVLFRSLLQSEHTLALRLLEITARRLQASSEREAALAFMDADARLARVLIALDQEESDKGYVTISQEELAQRAGVTRQTAASSLGRWRRRGWLLTGRGRIMILNHEQLQNLQHQVLS